MSGQGPRDAGPMSVYPPTLCLPSSLGSPAAPHLWARPGVTCIYGFVPAGPWGSSPTSGEQTPQPHQLPPRKPTPEPSPQAHGRPHALLALPRSETRNPRGNYFGDKQSANSDKRFLPSTFQIPIPEDTGHTAQHEAVSQKIQLVGPKAPQNNYCCPENTAGVD